MKIGYEAKRVFHNRTGLGNYGRDLVRMLSRYYPQNTYYLYHPKPARQVLFRPPAAHVVERLPRSQFDRMFPNLWRQHRVVRDLGHDGVELFHGLSGELPMGLAGRGIKSVVTIHDLIFMRFPQLYSRIDRTIYFQKFRYAAHHANRVIAISEQTKRDAVEFLGVDESKVAVIYQGCHSAFKHRYAAAEVDVVRKQYGLPPNFVLNVGTIEARKNALSAVKAIEHLDTHLAIVGRKTAYTKEIVAYIDTKGLASKVSFLHGVPLEDLAKLYQAARVFVYPSLFEGFGIPIIEALYSGVPVVTSDVGCFREAGGPDSRYVSPTDIEGLADAIQAVLMNPTLRRQMIDGGYVHSRKFDDERIAEQLMSLYREMMQTDANR